MSYDTKYKELVSHILNEGTLQDCRNGKQLIIPHHSFTLDFRKDNPILKLRKIYTKGIVGEFKTLMSPEQLTNVKQFEENGCNYWKAWARPEGTLNLDYYNMMHPQLDDIIEQMIADPDSRRHVVELWNHQNVKDGILDLPCCWHGLTFTVIDDTIHLKWVQRSVDTMVGLPSDVFLAYLIMHHVSDLTGYDVGSCMFALSNLHIYEEHVENAQVLLTRTTADYDNPLKFELKK